MKPKCQLCDGAFFNNPVVTLNNQPKTIKVYECKMCGLLQHILPPTPEPKQNISDKLKDQRRKWVDNFRDYYEQSNRGKELISFNELEHKGNLRVVMKNIREKYDRVLVSVPNFRYCNEVLIDHLYYFTPITLRRVFDMNGFEVDLCDTINRDNDIMLWAKKRPQTDYSYEKQSMESIIRKIEDLCNNNTVAIWGAGHRALALLGHGKLKPKYIVDSTPSKQGTFTKAMKTPIYPEKHLIDDPVDIVIIGVPETYKKEVVQKALAMPITSKIAFIGGKLEWII